MNSEQLSRLKSLDFYVKEADKNAVERDRYKQERAELLTQRQELLDALFSDYDTRLHLSAILLGVTNSLSQPSPIQTDPRQGE